MEHTTITKIAEALRAVAALLDEAADGAARAAAAQPELPVAAPFLTDEEVEARYEAPAPQGCAPEGIAPPDNQVPAPQASAEESSAVAPASLKEELEALDAADDSRAGKVITTAALANYSEQAAPEPSFEEMQAALLNVVRTCGSRVAGHILAGVNAWGAPDVPPWKRADVIQACNDALNEQELVEELGEAGWEE